MTWEEVQKATLSKLFAGQDGVINLSDWASQDAVAAMPQAANEGIQYICTVVPLRKWATAWVERSNKPTFLNLRTVCSRYKDFGERPQVYLMYDEQPGRPLKVSVLENNFLLIPPNVEGHIMIGYHAWPQVFETATAADTEIELPDDLSPLLPMYMAAELMKEIDARIATLYRNEFQVQLESVQRPADYHTTEFTSTTGW